MLVAVFDLGWEDLRIAMDYEGAHHWMSRARINHDIRKAEAVAELGWIDLRVTADDSEGGIYDAFQRRGAAEREATAKTIP